MGWEGEGQGRGRGTEGRVWCEAVRGGRSVSWCWADRRDATLSAPRLAASVASAAGGVLSGHRHYHHGRRHISLAQTHGLYHHHNHHYHHHRGQAHLNYTHCQNNNISSIPSLHHHNNHLKGVDQSREWRC